MGPIGCPETSLRNYRYTIRNSPEERKFQRKTSVNNINNNNNKKKKKKKKKKTKKKNNTNSCQYAVR